MPSALVKSHKRATVHQTLPYVSKSAPSSFSHFQLPSQVPLELTTHLPLHPLPLPTHPLSPGGWGGTHSSFLHHIIDLSSPTPQALFSTVPIICLGWSFGTQHSLSREGNLSLSARPPLPPLAWPALIHPSNLSSKVSSSSKPSLCPALADTWVTLSCTHMAPASTEHLSDYDQIGICGNVGCCLSPWHNRRTTEVGKGLSWPFIPSAVPAKGLEQSQLLINNSRMEE